MADIKKKGSLEKPKSKAAGFIPREAKSIIKEKYQEQQERNAPGQKDPVRYATDKVEGGGKRVARTAGDAIKQKAKNEFIKQRQRKKAEQEDTPQQNEPQPQQQNEPQLPPAEQPSAESSAPAPNEAAKQTVPPTSSNASPVDGNGSGHTGVLKSQGESAAPSQYYGQNSSTESTRFSTTDRANHHAETQHTGERGKALGKQKAIQDAKKTKEQQVQQKKFLTRDQAHLMESAQQNGSVNGTATSAGVDGGKGGTITKSLRGEAQISQGRRGGAVPDLPAAKESSSRVLGKKTGSKSIRPVKADGNRPKTGTVLQKRKTMAKGGKVAQKQVSPAQRAKALAQKKARQKAQKAMARKAAQQTKVAAAKAGKLAMRFAMAVGRAAAAAVQGILAAGGGIVLLIVMLCLILVAAIAASPFGIFFAGGGSEEGVPVSVAVAQVNYAYNATLEELQSGDTYDDVVIEGAGADWVEVLAVFAVKVAGSNEVDATDVVTLDENRIDRLEAVFWDMTTISHEVEETEHPESSEGADDGYTERVLHITITGKTAEEMAAEYGFTDQQLEMLQELLEEREMLEDLIGSLMDVTADAKNVLLNLPEDLSPEREAVIRAACSLVGKVNYFWGGKSLVLGWDSRWGRLTEVTAAGSSSTGTYRPYGLDCSGFVDWVFYNATGGEYIIGHGGVAMSNLGFFSIFTWA